ncbi:LytTR family DNA-binding domain-containing protein [Hymenobacter sp.]|uniref:LytR/AlgR family response regulator transcription factor n=1 Tax=Hymenobacter sp. TaxID=1898978 RepID=UPI00286BFC46|nr:LytTR family DNA-binding domain-containing protein [Hymenobacter sp.]
MLINPNDARLRVVVADDEPLARAKLRRWLEAEPDCAVLAECGNGYEVVETLRQAPADLLLLDIQMPGLDGFQALAQLAPAQVPLVVFVTAYDQYAVAAFEHHALDYLLKPYDHARFARSLARVRELRASQQPVAQLQALLRALPPAPPIYQVYFALKTPRQVRLLPVSEVHWIAAEGNFVRLHTPAGRHLLRDGLGQLAERLDPRQFVRIHRSTLLNLSQVRALHPASHGDFTVVLHDGTELALSRGYRAGLSAALGVPL